LQLVGSLAILMAGAQDRVLLEVAQSGVLLHDVPRQQLVV